MSRHVQPSTGDAPFGSERAFAGGRSGMGGSIDSLLSAIDVKAITIYE